jgi:hypothetical protein
MYSNIDNKSKLSGPKLVFKIFANCDYVADPINSRFDLVDGWY